MSFTLTEFTPSCDISFPFFRTELKREWVASALDKINEQFGANSIFYGSMYGAADSAPLRISFTSIPDVVAESGKQRGTAVKK